MRNRRIVGESSILVATGFQCVAIAAVAMVAAADGIKETYAGGTQLIDIADPLRNQRRGGGGRRGKS